MVNGVTKLVMTKADVLDSFKELKVCTSYMLNGKESTEIPFQMTRINIEPVYKQFDGWNISTSAAKSPAELPEAVKQYVQFINKEMDDDDEFDEADEVETPAVKKGKASSPAKKQSSQDEDDDDDVADQVDDWDKVEEEDNWDPDFEEFDIPKSKAKKSGGKKAA